MIRSLVPVGLILALVAGVAIGQDNPVCRVVELLHLVMWIEPTGDEFEALTTF